MSKDVEVTISFSVEPSEIKELSHMQFNLKSEDVASLVTGLFARLREIKQELKVLSPLNDQNSEDRFRQVDARIQQLSEENYDIQGLMGMLKESDAVGCIIPKESLEKGWSFEHNVDMPIAYAGQYQNEFEGFDVEAPNKKLK